MSDATSAPVAEADADEGDVLVSLRDLKTYYGEDSLLSGSAVKAVDGVSFDIHKGETLGLVGESGCGKTTLGRTLIQLEEATAGEVRFGDTDITELSGAELKKWRRNSQMVFQDPESSLNDRMTVGAIVREPLDVHDWKTPEERRDRVRELLDTVGLSEEHYYRYPHQFSGGQRQRVGIARALALEPEFVVLDEPVSALDVSVQAQILNLLTRLQDEFGLTYLFIAHDLSVVRHICDRVAVMYLGNVMELGPTERLFQNPQNPYTHSLLSAIPEPDPTSERERITLHGSPPSPRDPPKGCPFSTRCPMKIRPEEYEAVDTEAWVRIEMLREVLRERSNAERSLTERTRELLGLHSRFSTIDEIYQELFSDVALPAEIEQHVDEATRLVNDDREQEARSYLRDEFGSICDTELPDAHIVDETGGRSRCHRHTDEYEEPSRSQLIVE
ncbi:MAG: oligopeptide/dipeptide ABC transporter ATP-binding protein [Halolamina sp.]